ncbi:MAG: CoA pyrophosphatase [Lentimicrobium sp.]|jgi:8-oxo-dGTP pyrophosphatase MutT (NUDIX family)|nr:CoA pyrophosphatase [Lentimicrobium sp.]
MHQTRQPDILLKFSAEFTDLLKDSLPGAEAHERLAPSNRPELLKLGKNGPPPRLSSVLILMYREGNRIQLVFTKRGEYDGIHSGQVSFPGGKAEPEDHDLVDTALRETREEIGLFSRDISIIGKLSDLYVPPSNFIICPFVGILKGLPHFIPHPAEVAEIFSVPLSYLMHYGKEINHPVIMSNGTKMKVPGFKFGHHLIWGATAMILSEFLTLAACCPSINDIPNQD